MDKLDTVLRELTKLNKKVKDLEDLSLNYFSVIDNLNDATQIFAADIIEEIEKQKLEDEAVAEIDELSKPSVKTPKKGDLN